MTLPSHYERSTAEYWSLGAEQDFLNHLGTWAEGVKTKRLDLLNRYIQAAELRHRRPQWWDEAVKYAQWLIDREVGI